MKRKILFVAHAMRIGGVEKSLLSLLNKMDFDKHEVSLFLLKHDGDLMTYIPPQVRLLNENKYYTYLLESLKSISSFRHLPLLMTRFLNKIRVSQGKNTDINTYGLDRLHRIASRILPLISDEEYDVCISYLSPHYIARNRVKARKYISWIHTDYSNIVMNKKVEFKIWNKYNHVISISEDCSKSFVDVFPGLKDRMVLFENTLDKEYIDKMAQKSIENSYFKTEKMKLLSVGRFTYAKNYDGAVKIAKQLKENGLEFKWYLIGFGPDESLIRETIKNEGAEEYFEVLGKQSNPYPFIKYCDFFMQLSRYEGKAITVQEAQLLKKVSMISNYNTAPSQVTHKVDGIILRNHEDVNEIKRYFANTLLKDKIVKHLKEIDYSYKYEMKQFFKLL